LARIPTGPGADAHLSFTVPGAVDAYLTLLETYGTKSVSETLSPALQYAERGFPMYEYMHRMLAIPETRSQFALYPPGGEAVFYPNGRVPRVGELFVQPALAGTLKRLVEADVKARGDRIKGIASARERFYRDSPAVPLTELLSPEYLRERAKLIRPDTAMQDAPPPGDLSSVMGSARRPDSGRPGSGPARSQSECLPFERTSAAAPTP